MGSDRARRDVAVVVPMYKERLSPEERISLKHLDRFLGPYDRYIVAPAWLNPAREGFRVLHFPNRHFRSLMAYSQLMLMDKLYAAFQDYEYILIYHTDALVFSDQLLAWCAQGYDYIGAPWFRQVLGPTYPFRDACGNGGFSLRHVKSARRVLRDLRMPWSETLRRLVLTLPKKLVRGEPFLYTLIQSWTQSAPHRTMWFEDRFWSFEVPRHVPGFRIPGAQEGLSFAFELDPRFCFERNQRRLPFGCHKWTADPDFWEPYLIRD